MPAECARSRSCSRCSARPPTRGSTNRLNASAASASASTRGHGIHFSAIATRPQPTCTILRGISPARSPAEPTGLRSRGPAVAQVVAEVLERDDERPGLLPLEAARGVVLEGELQAGALVVVAEDE